MGSGGWRSRGLGWTTSGFDARWLPLRAEPRNPLARRGYAGSVHTGQHGGTQEDAYQGWHLLLASGYLVRLVTERQWPLRGKQCLHDVSFWMHWQLGRRVWRWERRQKAMARSLVRTIVSTLRSSV